jgi:hypothetical protein
MLELIFCVIRDAVGGHRVIASFILKRVDTRDTPVSFRICTLLVVRHEVHPPISGSVAVRRRHRPHHRESLSNC